MVSTARKMWCHRLVLLRLQSEWLVLVIGTATAKEQSRKI